MATTTVIPRDSYGHGLTPVENAAREQKIQELMAGGRDRISAENIADGRPEWSQRFDLSLPNLSKLPNTVKAMEQAARDNARLPRNNFTLQDLQIRHDDLNDKLNHWRTVQDAAAASLRRGQNILKEAREFLRDLKTHNDLDATADRNRCEDVIEKVEPRVEQDNKRLRIATGLVERYEKELREFPVAEYTRLREQENRRERLRF